MKRVAVLHAQVPFVRGGAESLVDGLVAAINRELPGVRAEVIQLPFKWYPEEELFANIMAWRLLDISESCGEPIDLVLGTKYPSYAALHPNKVIWLVHQHRVLYDLEGSEFDHPVLSPHQMMVREKLRATDTKLVSEAKAVYTISHTVSQRLLHYNGLDSTPLAPPSLLSDRIYPGDYSDYIVCFARLVRVKRQHLLIQALQHSPKTKAYIIGDGDPAYKKELQEMIVNLKLEDRCHLVGYAEDDVLLKYLANARAVFYAPLDEDYGYAAIEGFLAQKPLIACEDSGEVRRFVESSGSGWITSTSPLAIGEVLKKVSSMTSQELNQLAQEGYRQAKQVTWKLVLDKIVVPYL